MHERHAVFLLAVLGLVCSPLSGLPGQGQGTWSAGQVTWVADGVTVEMRIGAGFDTLRLAGVSVPVRAASAEAAQPSPARRAGDYLRDGADGRQIWFETAAPECRDDRGCLYAFLWLAKPRDDSEQEIRAAMLNAILLLTGHAQVSSGFADSRYTGLFAKLQAEAREAGRGLWGTAPAGSATAAGEITVYVTKTGTKYHRSGCRFLSGGGTPLSLAEAKTRGYTPCGVCKPPV